MRQEREEWVSMRPEWEPLQVKHPAWSLHGGPHYLRDPAFAPAARPSFAAGPSLREMVARHFEWSRDDGGVAEPWPWVWAQKPSIGSVVVVVGSDEKAAAALRLACTERSPLLTTVIAVGDEAALMRLGVGSAGGPTEKTGIIDAAVHSVDYEAKILLTTPRCIDRQPLSDGHSEERLLFFDELVVV